MYTENGLLVDIAEVREVIEKADVFTAAFRLFPERLLIDTRFDRSDESGACALPMVAIVDPVSTVQERFFWLGQHRPGLGMPKNFQFFFWPHSVRYLDESGVWGWLADRIAAQGFSGAESTAEAALRDLIDRERRATVDAIRGAEYQTLWKAE